jgi:hypothetical protein
MEAVSLLTTPSIEDAAPLMASPERLQCMAARDGFLFFRGLLPQDLVLALRRAVLDYAGLLGWLDADSPVGEARARPGKRIGNFRDPDWISLQAHIQTRPEMWALGDCAAIHRVLQAVGDGSRWCLSTANICRIFSPHPDMATPPHQDANYIRTMADFWTMWIPLGDCPRELGPIALLAGSHLAGLREHLGQGLVDSGVLAPDDVVWSTTDFCCGDALLFRPHTLHRSLPNHSPDTLRLSADFRYGFWDQTTAVDWRAKTIGW